MSLTIAFGSILAPYGGPKIDEKSFRDASGASLGRFWTTRIITLPNAPLVTRGPYRWLRHPNYVIVAMELAVLPLAFSDWLIALFFSLANAFLMHFRIPAENRILETRQTPNDEYQPNC